MESGGGGTEEEDERPILEAKCVYILMSKDHRISRNRRAEWFFSRIDKVLALPKDDVMSVTLDEGTDFFVVSAIPSDTGAEDWTPERRHEYKYKVTRKTVVTYLSRRYRIVYCIDVSPSVAAVDIQIGAVVFDRVFHTLRASLEGLNRPFYIPGSTILFQPKIFITVITHSPFVTCVNSEVIIQGRLLVSSNFNDILKTVYERLHGIENRAAPLTDATLKALEKMKSLRSVRKKEKVEGALVERSEREEVVRFSAGDLGLVDLLKQCLIALSLLPENSSSGLVILTDGVISVPDGRYLDIILSQLRYNTVSCSFIQLSSPFHPHLCHGVLPYVDLMKFIATATFGAFLTDTPEMASDDVFEMNIYHVAFLAWSFQNQDSLTQDAKLPLSSKPGEWSIRNQCFFTIRDMPIVKKLQFEVSLAVDYMKVLSCRLREGFMIKNIYPTPDGGYEITLILPWKFLIQLEYLIVTDPHSDSVTKCAFSLEGPYDFLHDVTCLAAKSFPSIYRQLMVNRFWATRKNLSESDRLLIHLNSFSSNPAYYTVPDSLRNGVPLFYFASNSTVPQLQSSDFPYAQFAQFWKPVCMLDTNVWQKWMHTHRIGIILEHDHPLPKYLHYPNPAGRFQVILCRQAIIALNTLLKNFSSFVLVENHSYVTLMYSDEEKSVPFSFYIIRVTSKPPYVVLRLAFLVGTPGNVRHKTVSALKEKIAALTFPQRLKEPPRWRFPSGGSQQSDQASKASWSDMPCCILMNKPIEKILIRYERIPDNFCEVLLSQPVYETPISNPHGSFGFKTTHPTPGAPPPAIMAPEMFNTVARYLYHKRWIWFFPMCILEDFGAKDVAEILAIITKMRLQEGFRFAYSSSGTVSMVLEVQVENQVTVSQDVGSTSRLGVTEETYLTPCVLQYVMFPPTTSLTPVHEEDGEAGDEARDLFLITECWAEPQWGIITNCQFSALNGLAFSDVADKIFDINKECILTLGAFDFLRGAQSGNNLGAIRSTPELPRGISGTDALVDNNIILLSFEFELGRLLPKCSQTEMLFSMFFQDQRHAFSLEDQSEFVPYQERSNEMLYNCWTQCLSAAHDKEVMIEPKYFESILTMVLSREDVTMNEKDSKLTLQGLPAWRCFVKVIDSSQLLISLIPKTLKDTKLLYLIIEKCKCVLSCSDLRDDRESAGPTLLMPQDLEADEIMKLRHRKISEPNFGQASVFVANNLAPSENFICGRKRIRAFSGGESGPVLKKAFTVDPSVHDALVQNFFEEIESKYVIPKTAVAEEFNLSTVGGSLLEPPADSLGTPTNPTFLPLAMNLLLPDMIGSLTMPLFMYDCSLTTLRNHLIYKGSQEVPDRCIDFRIFGGSRESLKALEVVDDNASVSSSSTECPGTEGKGLADDLEFTPSEVKEYCKALQLAYRSAFSRSVYHSLQLGYYVSSEDLKASISICQKDVLCIELSELLSNICNHDELDGSCKSSGKTRDFIQNRFREILLKDFICTKVDSDLFYFTRNSTIDSQDTTSIDNSSLDIPEILEGKPLESPKESEQWNDTSNYFNLNVNHTDMKRGSDANLEPLFLVLRCTFTSNRISRTFPVSNLPVCIDEFAPCWRSQTFFDYEAAPDPWKATLELLILTCPLEHEETSTVKKIHSVEECRNILASQRNALTTLVNEFDWLLRDEVTSLRADTSNLTADMLGDIATHVEKSKGKLGCYKHSIPLKFVVDEQQAYQMFVKKFASLSVGTMKLKKLDDWWYLVSSHTSSIVVDDSPNPDQVNSDVGNYRMENQSEESSMQNSSCVSSVSETGSGVGRLPFWIIFGIKSEHVVSYCHCRYDPGDVIPLEWCVKTRDAVVESTIHLVRVVNQDLLLQTLHETRLCNPLLEPERYRSNIDDSPLLTPRYLDDGLPSDGETDSSGTSFAPGTFACDVVWETTFVLHSRLKSGPGKSAFARGMQILRSALLAFEVTNRENMFVYRNSLGNVFYMRLYRVIEDDGSFECPSENPSPRSSISISSRTRVHHPSNESNKDDLPIIIRDRGDGLGGTTPDGIVLLRVHGVTEAGKEIKEELIQSLRNKLDDAVLDVLSVTLDRNPHCKLTPEDVHFIQRPYAAPDIIVRFTTGRFVKLLLPPFAYYLHQNLLQFMNIPKYTRPEQEFHFQDYCHSNLERASEEHNVYLYNQNPEETGSRGISCVSVTLIDKSGNVLHCMDWKRPCNFQFSLEMIELRTFVKSREVLSGEAGSDIMVEICVWKQGRINLDILKNNFISAIKHAGWDLAMEYQILTAPLLSPEALEVQETELGNNLQVPGTRISASDTLYIAPDSPAKILRRRNSSAAATDQELDRREELRERSWSYTVRGQVPSRKNSIRGPPMGLQLSPRGSTSSTDSVRSTFDFIGSRRNITDEIDNLHTHYTKKLRKWCDMGTSLNAPSLRKEKITFTPRHYLEETVHEFVKIVQSIAPDTSTAQFWTLNSTREFITVGRRIHADRESVMRKSHQDVSVFKSHETKLSFLESKDEVEYPAELLQLFASKERFQPSASLASCILIGRNHSHWEACVTNMKSLDTTLYPHEIIKSFYRFYPLMSEPLNLSDDKNSLNTDKMKFPSKNGLLALLGDTHDESCMQSVLVPRQRILVASLTTESMDMILYNWSKETSDKLVEQTKALANWNKCRWGVMDTVLLQKAGIFYNQPLLRESHDLDINIMGQPHADLKDFVKQQHPPKQITLIDRSNYKICLEERNRISDVYRNIHHAHLLPLRSTEVWNPIRIHGEQMLHVIEKGMKDVEDTMFRNWLSRGPSASNVIGKEAIEAMKQSARTIHYCMTPIFFLPQWRTSIALTRDSTCGIFKRKRVSSLDLNYPQTGRTRPRHASDRSSSQSSTSGPVKEKLVPVWTLWQRLQSESGSISPVSSKHAKKDLHPWHTLLCQAYILEYSQYLQTLGFIPAQGNVSPRKQSVLSSGTLGQGPASQSSDQIRRLSDGSVLSAETDKNSHYHSHDGSRAKGKQDQEQDDKIVYLQKSLPGGIILLEVGLLEPFSYCKIYAMEVHRIQANKYAQRASTSHNTIAFVDECDKMKILIHLHSFTYDFHLRTIQNHICGKQPIENGYNVTKFLDDFISYYCKGPSFARNTVNIGILSIPYISTPSHILFDYILTHNKKYGMAVLQMNQIIGNKRPEQGDAIPMQSFDYGLVCNLTRKVAYKESEDESHLGEFEMSLVISHDTQPSARTYNNDPSVLKIKYYIVLTSRRELYPNLTGDLNRGKLFPVTAPEPLCDIRQEFNVHRKTSEDGIDHDIKESEPTSRSFSQRSEYSLSESLGQSLIREEKVHYMGYFSSHEQIMQQILKEHSTWAEKFIKTTVEAAAVDCRRDLLWQRLQLGGRKQIKPRTEMDELTYRETEGVLTFWEFSELLELIHSQSLRELDPQLAALLSQPANFFQTLMKLLANSNYYHHRYFVAPDGKIHQLAIINPFLVKSVVLIEMNLVKQTNDISILFKEVPDASLKELHHEFDTEIYNLIETAVGACCYCNWINCL